VRQEAAHDLRIFISDFASRTVWCGVAVPLTPDVPGVDIARAQLGALSRPGRRAMVLQRLLWQQTQWRSTVLYCNGSNV